MLSNTFPLECLYLHSTSIPQHLNRRKPCSNYSGPYIRGFMLEWRSSRRNRHPSYKALKTENPRPRDPELISLSGLRWVSGSLIESRTPKKSPKQASVTLRRGGDEGRGAQQLLHSCFHARKTICTHLEPHTFECSPTDGH